MKDLVKDFKSKAVIILSNKNSKQHQKRQTLMITRTLSMIAQVRIT